MMRRASNNDVQRISRKVYSILHIAEAVVFYNFTLALAIQAACSSVPCSFANATTITTDSNLQTLSAALCYFISCANRQTASADTSGRELISFGLKGK